MRRLAAAMVLAIAVIFIIPGGTAYAIALPDSSPTVVQIDAYKNILEMNDFLILVYENTPYATTPSTPYSNAFVWRLFDTDGTTELGQAVGSDYNDYGYGYNVISFYFDADDAPAGFWETPYYIKLTGTSSAFTVPPEYTYEMSVPDYSDVIDYDLVKAAIAERIIALATDLNTRWEVPTAYSLLDEAETGTKLSIYGQAFFRSAIYGIQSMVPNAFPFAIANITNTDRSWTDAYVAALAAQYAGTYLEDAEEAGEELLAVNYNLMGLLMVLALCVVIIFAHWYVGSPSRWTGLIESAPLVIIGGRISMLGLGELGLFAAICWLYITGRTWKVF